MVYFRPPEVEIATNVYVPHEKMEFIMGHVIPWRNESMTHCITVCIKHKSATQQQWKCGAFKCWLLLLISVFLWLCWSICSQQQTLEPCTCIINLGQILDKLSISVVSLWLPLTLHWCFITMPPDYKRASDATSGCSTSEKQHKRWLRIMCCLSNAKLER